MKWLRRIENKRQKKRACSSPCPLLCRARHRIFLIGGKMTAAAPERRRLLASSCRFKSGVSPAFIYGSSVIIFRYKAWAVMSSPAAPSSAMAWRWPGGAVPASSRAALGRHVTQHGGEWLSWHGGENGANTMPARPLSRRLVKILLYHRLAAKYSDIQGI